jgi:hypothetical protein
VKVVLASNLLEQRATALDQFNKETTAPGVCIELAFLRLQMGILGR